MRTSLAEMGHKQPPTPVATEKTSAKSKVEGTAKQKRSQIIDTRFYWVRDRVLKTFSTYSGKKERESWHSITKKTPDMVP